MLYCILDCGFRTTCHIWWRFAECDSVKHICTRAHSCVRPIETALQAPNENILRHSKAIHCLGRHSFCRTDWSVMNIPTNTPSCVQYCNVKQLQNGKQWIVNALSHTRVQEYKRIARVLLFFLCWVKLLFFVSHGFDWIAFSIAMSNNYNMAQWIGNALSHTRIQARIKSSKRKTAIKNKLNKNK